MNDEYTIDELVSKLLKHNNEQVFSSPTSGQIIGLDIFTAEHDTGNIHTLTFETLITIFIELAFGLAKIDKIKGPDYNKFNIADLLPIIADKMLLLKYFVRTEVYEKADILDDFKELSDGRYARIILRNYDDYMHFVDVPKDLFYHLKLNALTLDKKYKKLEDVYGLMIVDKVYKISFAKM